MMLIADSGSTKTHWRFVGQDNQILQCETIGFNPYHQTSEAISSEIRNVLLPQLPQSTVNDKITIHFYGAGCSTESKCAIVRTSLTECFPNASIEVDHDLLAAARALCGSNSGIAAILGTGSNSCYYDGKDIVENVTSLGYILGDEGSGVHIGKTFITAYLNNELPKSVTDIFNHNKVLTAEEILDNVYKKPLPNRYLASFSKFVFRNINDAYLNKMVYDCMEQFFDKHICKYEKHKEVKVSFVGSVAFYYNSILKNVAAKKGIQIGTIIESPIAALTLYHLEGKKS